MFKIKGVVKTNPINDFCRRNGEGRKTMHMCTCEPCVPRVKIVLRDSMIRTVNKVVFFFVARAYAMITRAKKCMKRFYRFLKA